MSFLFKDYSNTVLGMVTRHFRGPRFDGHRLYLSDHLLRDVIPIWDHYSTEVMVMSRDLLAAEIQLQGHDPMLVFARTTSFRWVHSVLTPPVGLELRVIDWPGVLAWGFI